MLFLVFDRPRVK